MRVTDFVSRQRRTADILKAEARWAEAQDQVSSGRRIRQPSDAPNEIPELLRLRSGIAELTRRRDAADVALPAMRSTEAALGDISDSLREVRLIALQANNATSSPEQRQLLAEHVERIRDRVRDLANTQIYGRYLFAGTNTDTEPFTAGPTVTYTGNDGAQTLSLGAGAALATNVTGEALRNPRGATDLFQNLTDLAAAIRSGSGTGITQGLTELDSDVQNVIGLRGDMGARQQYLERAREQIEDDVTAARERQSQLEDADLAEAVVEEKSAQHTHEAALAMAARLHQQSLLDFLR